MTTYKWHKWNVNFKTHEIFYNDVEKVSVLEMYQSLQDIMDEPGNMDEPTICLGLNPRLIEILKPYKLHKHAFNWLYGGGVVVGNTLWMTKDDNI